MYNALIFWGGVWNVATLLAVPQTSSRVWYAGHHGQQLDLHSGSHVELRRWSGSHGAQVPSVCCARLSLQCTQALLLPRLFSCCGCGRGSVVWLLLCCMVAVRMHCLHQRHSAHRHPSPQIQHCLHWAKEHFDNLFKDRPTEVNSVRRAVCLAVLCFCREARRCCSNCRRHLARAFTVPCVCDT